VYPNAVEPSAAIYGPDPAVRVKPDNAVNVLMRAVEYQPQVASRRVQPRLPNSNVAGEEFNLTIRIVLSFRLVSGPDQAVPNVAFIPGKPGRSPHPF